MSIHHYEGTLILTWGDWMITESLHRPHGMRFGVSREGEKVWFAPTFAEAIDQIAFDAFTNNYTLPSAEPITYRTENRHG